ncbi:hypothetical protein ACLMJK_006787 [Lecanora helva]
MQPDQRVSPKAAIQDWLLNVVAKPGLSHPVGGNKQTGPHIKRQHSDQHRSTGKRADSTSEVLSPIRVPAQYAKEAGGGNLAERLGLHAPFRTFKDHGKDEQRNINSLKQPFKRRRRGSSTDSYLHFAIIDDTAELDRNNINAINQSRSKKGDFKRERTVANHSSNDLIASNLRTSTPEPIKSYGRRKRHKTRNDHYDLKEHDGTRQKRHSNGQDGSKKTHKPHKRREKSGAALLHDFAAENVTQDRLTLEPSKPLGLFGKGRASSPIKRRGLPDLAFAELPFLNAHRVKPQEEIETSSNERRPKDKQRKSAKAADTEAEISRYFTQAQPMNLKTDTQRYEGTQQESRTKAQPQTSVSTLIDLPESSFLGFGSCGVNSVSPTKPLNDSALKDVERRLITSSTRSTSCLTWSSSAAPSERLTCAQKDRVTSPESPRFADRYSQPDASQQNRESQLRGLSVNAEIASNEKSDVIENSTSDKMATSRSQSTKQSIKSARIQMSKPNTGRQREELEHASCIDKGLVGSSPDRHCIGSYSVCESPKPSKTSVAWEMASASPRKPESGPPDNAAALDETLEKLLQECRRPKYTKATPRLEDQPVRPISGKQDLGSGSDCRCTSERHQPEPASSANAKIHAVRDVGNYDSYGACTLAVDGLNVRGVSYPSSRCETISPRRPFPKITSDLPRLHERSTGNSRSAWTGYETIYERQQDLSPLYTLNDGDWENDTRHQKSKSCNEVGVYLDPPQASDQVANHHIGRCEHGRGQSLCNRNDELEVRSDSGIPAMYEFLNSPSDWYDIDQDLLADYGQISPALGMVQGNGFEMQERVLSEGASREARPPYKTSEADVQVGDLRWENGSHGPAANYGMTEPYDTMNEDCSADDPALSSFWAPHKLY